VKKTAPTEFPISPVLAERWSPIAFAADRAIDEDTMKRLFEAARWAPSCFNEQPWMFVVGHKGTEAFDRLADCLAEANGWAKNASVLALSVARMKFEKNGQPNRFGMYDTGAAVAHLLVQAEAEGLVVHQMGGYDAAKAREQVGLSEGQEPCAMLAIGYYGDRESLPEKSRQREEAPRQRRPQSEFVFVGKVKA
jgi:nitroreductase